MARTYAKVVGVVVLLVGVVGLFVGDRLLGFNSDMGEDIVHVLTGGLLAYVGFKGADSAVKSTVTAISVLYLLVAILGYFMPEVFGLTPSDLGIMDHVLHLVLGVLGLLAVMSDRTATTTS